MFIDDAGAPAEGKIKLMGSTLLLDNIASFSNWPHNLGGSHPFRGEVRGPTMRPAYNKPFTSEQSNSKNRIQSAATLLERSLEVRAFVRIPAKAALAVR